MKIIILCIALFSIIAFSGCLEEKISEEDFEISVEWNDVIPPNFNIDSNTINDEFKLNIKTNRDWVYYKVYDKSKNVELNKRDSDTFSPIKSTYVGMDALNSPYAINLDSFEEQKQIDVYFALDDGQGIDGDFNINDEGVIKLSAILPKRKMDFEVTPSIIKYTISKSMDKIGSINSRQITIKNTGDVVLHITTYSPPYDTNDDFYPKYKPYYRGFYSNILKPGETVQCEIESRIDHMPGYNTPINVYQTDLYIGALFNEYSTGLTNAHYVKTFTLETTVVE